MLMVNTQVLDLTDDFADLKVIRHYDTREFSTQLLQMEAAWKKLKNCRPLDREYAEKTLTPLLDESQRELSTIRATFEDFANAWTETAKYLGEELDEYATVLDPPAGTPRPAGSVHSKKQPNHMFITLDLFFQAFQDAVKQNRNGRTATPTSPRWTTTSSRCARTSWHAVAGRITQTPR